MLFLPVFFINYLFTADIFYIIGKNIIVLSESFILVDLVYYKYNTRHFIYYLL